MSRAFAPILAANGGGTLINVLSILARMASPAGGGYSASKAAALSLTQAVRAELQAQGTRVIGVLPGFVDTAMAEGVTAPKIQPSEVVRATLDVLLTDQDEVYRASRPPRLLHCCCRIPRRSSASWHSQLRRNAHWMGASVRDTTTAPWAMLAVIRRAVLAAADKRGESGRSSAGDGVQKLSPAWLSAQAVRLGNMNEHGFLMRHTRP